QEKCLTGKRRDVGELLLSGEHAFAGGGGTVDRHRVPDFREQAIEGNPRPPGVFDHGAVRDQGFQRGSDVGVPGRLVSGQGSRIASQKWYVLSYRSGRIGHGTLPFHLLSLRGKNRPVGKKFHDTERTVLRHVILR